MPAPAQHLPFLSLTDIDFSAPKCQPLVSSSACIPGPSRKIEVPSPREIKNVLHMLRKKIRKSLVYPCSNDFVQSSEHLTKCKQSIFKPTHLENTYTKLLTLAESHIHEEAMQAMIDHLQMTQNQSNSRDWFRYTEGRITASHFRHSAY